MKLMGDFQGLPLEGAHQGELNLDDSPGMTLKKVDLLVILLICWPFYKNNPAKYGVIFGRAAPEAKPLACYGVNWESPPRQ